MREDHFTNTPEDAGRYEEMRAETDAAADRPTRAEAERDACLHLHQTDIAVDDPNPAPRVCWVCDDCGEVCDD